MTLRPDYITDADLPLEFGRYTLLSVLGEGGMARVFRAEMQGPEGFRKPAAVKIIRSDVARKGRKLRQSLVNEARLGGLLLHPNVVNTYEFGEAEGLPFIAMELVKGVGLDAVVGLGPMPVGLALEVGAQICAGLDHAHHLEEGGVEASLVHRDLKPSNVLLSRDGLVKIMDFGIAKATDQSDGSTETGMTKGTPAYMSPEQVGGEALTPRSDLFAVGALLHELVTGDRLFSGSNIMATLMQVAQVEQRLEELGVVERLDGYAPGLGEVVRGCLRREAEDRWPDAADVEHRLRLVSRQLSPPPPLKTWVRELMKREGIGLGSGEPTTANPVRPDTDALRAWARVDGAGEGAGADQDRTRVDQFALGLPPRGAPSTPPAVPLLRPDTVEPPVLPRLPGGGATQPDDQPRRRGLPLWVRSAAALPVLAAVAWFALGGPGGPPPGDGIPMGGPVAARAGAASAAGGRSADAPDAPDAAAGATDRAGTEAQGGRAADEPGRARGSGSDSSGGERAAASSRGGHASAPAGRSGAGASESSPSNPASTPEDPAPGRGAQPAGAQASSEPSFVDSDDRPDERAPSEPAAEPGPPVIEVGEIAVSAPSAPAASPAGPPALAEPPAPAETGAAPPGAAATPKQGAKPAPTTPPATLAGNVRMWAKGGDLKVEFMGRVEGPDAERAKVFVHFDPPGADWVDRPLKHRGGGEYKSVIGFLQDDRGVTKWYVTAETADGRQLSYGSRAEPRTFRVK